jgi:hypothetical protein
MEVNLSPELQAKLAHIAAENNGGAEEYVRQLAERYLNPTLGSAKRSRRGLGSSTRESSSPTKKLARTSIRYFVRK